MLLAQGQAGAFVGGAGSAILFVATLVALTICSILYLIFASHYFLVTIIDSTSGHDEVHYPNDETVADWWWKPIFCAWLLFIWIVPGAFVVFPMLFHSMPTFLISWGVLLWFVFPLGVISALYTRNWFFFMHPIILWRMLTHFPAFAYVHFITSLIVAIAVGLVAAALTHHFFWALPAAFAAPAALLLYARHWGRFAWLSLNFAPRGQKRGRAEQTPSAERRTQPRDADAPEMTVQEIDDPSEGRREGQPPGYSHGIQPAPIEEEEDEYAVNKKPYGVIDDPTIPSFHETPAEPINAPVNIPTAQIFQEEEDEWSTDKKPYLTTEHPEAPTEGVADADKPVTNTDYFDKRARKEKAAKKKAQEEATRNFMPTPSNQTPTFRTALFAGVWNFMLETRTLRVFANLVVLTIFELFLMYLLVLFGFG